MHFFCERLAILKPEKKVNIIIKAERNTEKRIQKGNYGNKYNNNLLCMTTLRKYGILSNSCSYE